MEKEIDGRADDAPGKLNISKVDPSSIGHDIDGYVDGNLSISVVSIGPGADEEYVTRVVEHEDDSTNQGEVHQI